MNFSVFLSCALWRTATNPGDTPRSLGFGARSASGPCKIGCGSPWHPPFPPKPPQGGPAVLGRTARRSHHGGLRSLKIGFSCIWFPPCIEEGVLGSSTTWNSYPPRANGGQDVAFPFCGRRERGTSDSSRTRVCVSPSTDGLFCEPVSGRVRSADRTSVFQQPARKRSAAPSAAGGAHSPASPPGRTGAYRAPDRGSRIGRGWRR